MKRLFFIIAVLLICISVSAADQVINISGTWVQDAKLSEKPQNSLLARSSLDGRGFAQKMIKLIIEQTSSIVKITNVKFGNGPDVVEVFLLNGKPNEEMVNARGAKYEDKAKKITKVRISKDKFETDEKTDTYYRPTLLQKSYSLSNNGKTLTMKISSTEAGINFTQKLVFQKQ